MSSLAQQIHIRTAYTRSINLPRDQENLELVKAYVPTSRAIQALERFLRGLAPGARPRALALIGPYGAGKSAFALFTSALTGPKTHPAHQAAMATLRTAQPDLAERFQRALIGQRGFLRVPINGIPDSLVRQLMLGMAMAAEQNGFTRIEAQKLREAAQPGAPLDQVLMLIRNVQRVWSLQGGTGLLIEIDELGKFLEYEAHHPQHREIHLLQLLAEHAQEADAAPLHLLVLLHQGFEYYSHRLGKNLRDEWQKVQGRFEAIAFLEPADQALRIVAAAFATPETTTTLTLPRHQLDQSITCLSAEGALPLGLDEDRAGALLGRCYPLHPLTLLILPVLCQKVAQNERTLFSYLGSREPFGLLERLARMQPGDWIEPWELYDYFILNQVGGLTDPLTYHRWVEVSTALERFDSPPESAAVRLLKTIGLLNLIGAQRGLKASRAILELLFGVATEALLASLETASVIHFRHYSQEYRVWQGSDFDLRGALDQALAEQGPLPLVEVLNTLTPLKPLVARRATIRTGTLRCFTPGFTGWDRWPPRQMAELPLWFYLAEEQERPDFSAVPPRTVVAVCPFVERLREVVAEWLALRDLPKRHATLHQDPVAQREYQAWLNHAERETMEWLSGLLEEPEALTWFFGGVEQPVRDRRDLQQRLSAWVEAVCYPQAPLLRNELINWDRPSPSAHTGRKRLLAAMLQAADQDGLGIEKSPAEKSLYLSLLKASGLHRQEAGRWGFYPPPAADPCRIRPVWEAITQRLGGERQVGLPEIYERLRQAPFGVKLGGLPVLITAYLLAYRREVALYREDGFCEALTLEELELLCRRPELFALERFDLGGLRGELFDQYLHSIVGKVREDATLLDIVRPLMRFMAGLPDYTRSCRGLSGAAERVRAAFQQAKSPGVLLFEALPEACGVSSADFVASDRAVVERFIQRLVQALRELSGAYPGLLDHWQAALNRALLDAELADLAGLRRALAQRYGGLDRYTPDQLGLGALIRRLTEAGPSEDTAWLESVATLIGRSPPQKWREETRLQAELRLREVGEQLRDLEQLQAASAIHAVDGAVLLKRVDAERGEVSRVIQLSSTQWAAAGAKADELAAGLAGLDESVQLAVVAALLGRFSEPRPLDEPLTEG